MNILIIAWADSWNFWIPAMVNVFQSKNTSFRLLKTYSGDEHNRMLQISEDLIVKDYEQAVTELGSIDVAIYGTLHDEELFKKLEEDFVFCVSIFDHYLPSKYVFGGSVANSHLTFCFGKKFIDFQTKHGIKHSFMAIGAPQYDEFLSYPSRSVSTEKVVLFLEQHIYPAGKEGKTALANMLISAAKALPEYKFIIKPRTIPSQMNVALHRAEHLFDFINSSPETRLPKNLKLLDDHVSLNELTHKADIVVTACSTAIYPAILLGKKIIFVKGLPSIETEYFKEIYIKDFYENLSDTKAVVHYTDFIKSIKKSKRICNDELGRLYESIDSPVSENIYDVIEYIVNFVYKNGNILPTMIFSYNDYKKTIKDFFENSSLDIEDQQKDKRLKREYTKLLSNFFILNLRSNFMFENEFLDFRRILLEKFSSELNNKNELESFLKETLIFSDEYIYKLLKNKSSFLGSFPESLISFYIKIHFQRKEFKHILTLTDKLCNYKSFDYYSGLYYEKKGCIQLSIKYYKNFTFKFAKEKYNICHLSIQSVLTSVENKISYLESF